MFYYRLAQAVSWIVATFIFKRKIVRNEISGKKGPFVVIANHQAALDFVNLIGITRKPMTFVISNSFYNTLPVKGILNKIGVIPKQQFQTTVRDMKKMKSVIESGGILVIYPAGLMCEDGLQRLFLRQPINSLNGWILMFMLPKQQVHILPCLNGQRD